MEHLNISDFSFITWWWVQALVNSLYLFGRAATPSRTCVVSTRTIRAAEPSVWCAKQPVGWRGCGMGVISQETFPSGWMLTGFAWWFRMNSLKSASHCWWALSTQSCGHAESSWSPACSSQNESCMWCWWGFFSWNSCWMKKFSFLLQRFPNGEG